MLKLLPTTNYANPKSKEEGKRDRSSLIEILEQLRRRDALSTASANVRPLLSLFNRRSGSTDSRLKEIREDALTVFGQTRTIFQTYDKIGSVGVRQNPAIASEEDIAEWDACEARAAKMLQLKEPSSEWLKSHDYTQRRLTRYAALILHRVVHYCEDLNNVFWTNQGLEGVLQTRNKRIKEHLPQYTASLAELRHAISQFRIAEQGGPTQFFRVIDSQAVEVVATHRLSTLAADGCAETEAEVHPQARAGPIENDTTIDNADTESDASDLDYVGSRKHDTRICPTHKARLSTNDRELSTIEDLRSAGAGAFMAQTQSTHRVSSQRRLDLDHRALTPGVLLMATKSIPEVDFIDSDSETASEAGSEGATEPGMTKSPREICSSPQTANSPSKVYSAPIASLLLQFSSPTSGPPSSTPPTSPMAMSSPLGFPPTRSSEDQRSRL